PCVPLEGLTMSARPPQRKPWFHAPSGFWCAQIAGKRHYLDRDPVVAQRKLKKLLDDLRRGGGARREWLDLPLPDLADEFLEGVKARKAPATYLSYQQDAGTGHDAPGDRAQGRRRPQVASDQT